MNALTKIILCSSLACLPLVTSAQTNGYAEAIELRDSTDQIIDLLEFMREDAEDEASFYHNARALNDDNLGDPELEELKDTNKFNQQAYETAFQEMFPESISFTQKPTGKGTSIIKYDRMLGKKDWDIQMNALAFHYDDGETKTFDGNDSLTLESGYSTPIYTEKTLKRIDVEVVAHALDAVTPVKIPADRATAVNAFEHEFEIVHNDNKHVVLKTDAHFDTLIDVQARLADGRITTSSSSLYGYGAKPETVGKLMEQMAKDLAVIEEKARNDVDLNFESFKDKYVAQVREAESRLDDGLDDAYYVEYAFLTPVDELYVYYLDPERSKQRLFIINGGTAGIH